MFYLAGVAGVPRRYAVYPAEIAQGAMLATISLIFIGVLLLGGAALHLGGRQAMPQGLRVRFGVLLILLSWLSDSDSRHPEYRSPRPAAERDRPGLRPAPRRAADDVDGRAHHAARDIARSVRCC